MKMPNLVFTLYPIFLFSPHLSYYKGQQTFSVKGQKVNILDSVDRAVCHIDSDLLLRCKSSPRQYVNA